MVFGCGTAAGSIQDSTVVAAALAAWNRSLLDGYSLCEIDIESLYFHEP
jgi:hypothetical protein